jgi:hypothetical protein
MFRSQDESLRLVFAFDVVGFVRQQLVLQELNVFLQESMHAGSLLVPWQRALQLSNFFLHDCVQELEAASTNGLTECPLDTFP